jgi:hypothetical protein
MSSPTSTIARWLAGRAPIAAATVLFASGLVLAPSASAGTYPMYQCSGAHPNVAPGWSVYGADTTSSTVLSDTCDSGGAIGLYVYANNVPGEFTNAAPGGGSVGLGVNVDGPPDVTIAAVTAQVTVSSNSGDVAFLGFNSAGTLLPGMVELPYEAAGPYVTTDSWTLPTGATNFTAFVNCSTEKAQPACYFPDSTEVPALNDITITLADSVPPSLSDISGSLATAAAHSATVSGAQTVGFTGTDMNSGVRSATLTLTPQNGEAPYIHTFSFAAQCTYESWNACPTSENVGPFALETSSLNDDTYAVSITVTDAAGNVTSEGLGTITTRNAVNTSLGTPPGPGFASSGAGSPNGSGASKNAHLRLGVHSPVARSYGRRAFRISGRLLNAQGLPIAGATLDVLQQIDGASVELVGHARTSAGGAFISTVPAGPSRTIEIAYRAFSADSGFTATAKVREAVGAGVQLTVSPRRTGSEGTITLSGRVLGPVPPQGVVVELLVHYRGHWEPFRDPRTDAHGRFRVVYQFEGGVGRFPFRALVFGSQEAFPFAFGESRTVDVITN